MNYAISEIADQYHCKHTKIQYNKKHTFSVLVVLKCIYISYSHCESICMSEEV